MRRTCFFALVALTFGWLSSSANAAPEGWHRSLKDGLEASAKSGKPLLLVTAWKEKV